MPHLLHVLYLRCAMISLKIFYDNIFTIFRWGFSILNARAHWGKDLQETVSHEYILKILLADFYIDKNYYIDIFHFDDYLDKQLTGSSGNQFFFSFDRFRGGVTML